MMFATRFVNSFRRPFGNAQGKERRARRIDLVNEQVKQVLSDSGQKLILMVRS